MSGFMGVILPMTAPLIKKQIRINFNNLKQILESQNQ